MTRRVAAALLLGTLATAAAPAQPSPQDEAAWIATAKALVHGRTLATPAEAAATVRLLRARPASASKLAHYWQYLLARSLRRFAGADVAADGDAEAVRVPAWTELCATAAAAADASGSIAARGDAWFLLGDAHIMAGEDDAARAALQRGLDLPPEAGHCPPHTQLAMLEMAAGDLRAARRHVERALATKPTDAAARSAYIRAAADGTAGEFFLEIGLLPEAAAHFRDAAGVLGEDHVVVRKRRLDLLHYAGRFAELGEQAGAWRRDADAAGDADRAAAIYRINEAIALSRLPGREPQALEMLGELASHEHRDVAAAARVWAADLALDQGDLVAAAKAIDGIERPRILDKWHGVLIARARLLLATDAEIPAQLEHDLEGAVQQFLEQWDLVEPRPGGVGFLHLERRRALVSALMQVRVRRHPDGARRALADLLAVTDRGAFARRMRLGSTSLEAALRLVPPDGALVAWLPAGIGSHLFVLVDGRVHRFDVAGERRLRPQIATFVDLVSRPATDPDARADLAHRLRDALFPPPAWRLIASRPRLLVVGAEVWGRLPFEALAGDTQPFVGWSHAVAHVPSLAVGVWLKGRAAVPPIERVGLAWAARPWPEVRERWQLGALDVDEARLVAALDAWTGVPIRAVELDLDTWRPPAPDYQLILAHGVYDATAERPAALAIGGAPGLARSEHIENAAAAPFTTVLACQAGRAPLPRGEDGGNHLGAALFAAGAHTVVLANHDIELNSAVALATAMHEELAAAPLAPAEALRRARIRVGSQPTFRAPAYHCLLRVNAADFAPVRVALQAPAAWPRLVVGALLAVAAIAVAYQLSRWARSARCRSPSAVAAPDTE
ncbi:MAG: CHAT domain-containing protein [Planctomycetota bacterium]